MIEVNSKKDCVGCNACAQICPRQCISMMEDKQGFKYPHVDVSRCVGCDMCVRVCPVINQSDEQKPIITLAAYNKQVDVLRSTSSGGIFSVLSELIIRRGGVVFGAVIDSSGRVYHCEATDLEGIKAFCGSKYVQSEIGTTFVQAQKRLKQGKPVLFSGTPCQIAGLKKFLRKDWGGQLITVEVICHGVPSPLIWEEYFKTVASPKGEPAGKNTVFQSLKEPPVITGISFRDKRLGWEKFGFSIRYAANEVSGKNSVFQSAIDKSSFDFYESKERNLFLRGFLRDLYLRPSCFSCPSKSGKSQADIALGDLWGAASISPASYDIDGVTLVITYNDKAEELLQQVLKTPNVKWSHVDYEKVIPYNPAIEKSAKKPLGAYAFWPLYKAFGLKAIPISICLNRLESLFKKIV